MEEGWGGRSLARWGPRSLRGYGRDMLGDGDRQEIRRRLEQERERALDALREFDRTRETSLLEDTGELSMYRLHPADIGTEAMEQEKAFLLASNEGRRLLAIDDALRRMVREPERFGRCGRCDRAIGLERLDVLPYAAYCTDCQILMEEQSEPG
jgi:DnaK suppressor protein